MSSLLYIVWYWSVAIICVITHSIIGLLCFLTPSPKENHRILARFFIKIIAWGMGLKVSVSGAQYIPRNTSAIIMPNHRSLIDILVMMIAIPCHFNFISKKELMWVPFIGTDLLFEGDFFIDRSNPRKAKACLDKVEKHLKNNGRALIFPEGTRSETNQLLPFKRGAFKLSATSKAPIIPCYIDGSANIVKKKSLIAQPGTVHVTFMPPINAPESTSKDSLQQTLNQTFKCIQRVQVST